MEGEGDEDEDEDEGGGGSAREVRPRLGEAAADLVLATFDVDEAVATEAFEGLGELVGTGSEAQLGELFDEGAQSESCSGGQGAEEVEDAAAELAAGALEGGSAAAGSVGRAFLMHLRGQPQRAAPTGGLGVD